MLEAVPGDLAGLSKVTHHMKSQGAINGRVVTALKEGTGQVLVLVALL